ncbi:MAG TPA: ATP-binding cassette domain-containing protein [Gemmatimonadales bacterium]
MNLLELLGIDKSFGSVHAVRGADFALARGEVHALVGENGAGKSTLMHVACGMLAADAGSIRVEGREVRIRSPRDARALGIGMVHQHFTTIGGLSVRENLALGAGKLDAGKAEWPIGGGSRGVVDSLMAGIAPDAPVRTLSVAQRQRLEIVKALASGATILLLDEPTALLAPSEVEELLALLRALAGSGGAIALITHKLSEVMAAADRVTVLRRGKVTLSASVKYVTAAGLAEAMIGGAEEARGQAGEEGGGAAGETRVTVGDTTIRAGELVGIAAVEGNGQRELLRAIAGLGRMSDVSVRGTVSFVPEDRTIEGLIPELSITENLVLGMQDDARWTRGPVIDWPGARAHAATVIRSYGIVASGPDARAATLSGGNQQKVVLARALEQRPQVLVAENPTRGLDIRATREVHERLREAAREGVAVLVYSTDLDEVLELGRRILVLHRGRAAETPPGADRRVVGEMMLGVGGQR